MDGGIDEDSRAGRRASCARESVWRRGSAWACVRERGAAVLRNAAARVLPRGGARALRTVSTLSRLPILLLTSEQGGGGRLPSSPPPPFRCCPSPFSRAATATAGRRRRF